MKGDGFIDDKNRRDKGGMYQEQYKSCLKKSHELSQSSDRVSLLRFLLFALAALFLFIGYQQKNPAFLIPVLGLGAAFVLLIRYHGRLAKEQACLKDSQSVLKDYLARLEDGWKMFPTDGAIYLKEGFLEAGDLDLFGKNSLYQYLCTAGTIWGQDQLAQWLSLAGKDFTEDLALQLSQEIRSRQQAVAELAQKADFCMELETGARPLRDMGYEESQKIMDDFFLALGTKSRFPMAFRILLRLFPLLTLTFLFSALLGVYRHLAWPLFFLLASAQLMSAFLGFYWNNKALSPIYQMNRAVTPYRKLFQLLENEVFDSPYLVDLQKVLRENGSASAALKELEAISESVCARRNIYAFLLYNSLFLHDYHCMERYVKWKGPYRDQMEPWLQALGSAEALVSLGVICRTRKTCCLPEILDSRRPVLAASGLRHPLLKESAAVGNDLNLAHSACVITGSNMSGKTTFMRSIGANIALAYAGGFCTAAGFRVSLMRLCTSIRTVDDVSEGISTFYAELLRIQRMMETSRKQLPMISLIDEIYKGTNSKDRIFAAKETIRKLSAPYAFVLVTTHDFELCDLEYDKGMDVKNYHFAETYQENKIHFDYKLKDGRCTTTNARYLLRMAGILQGDF